jgi:hypothetical protein
MGGGFESITLKHAFEESNKFQIHVTTYTKHYAHIAV